jgi:hypothetical protein
MDARILFNALEGKTGRFSGAKGGQKALALLAPTCRQLAI